ncbi:hypothetical protein Shyd_56350 [Streptomyces hydrogenans]|uniref:Uncharacterized protein n=1 Tax=Streptomyces hydrogenans TaxID=1873719 RepID=A0ABQ3PGW3_9ACTN|nr:hypothetical protein Shyd_56350 [Streptomyces hydrogenans]
MFGKLEGVLVVVGTVQGGLVAEVPAVPASALVGAVQTGRPFGFCATVFEQRELVQGGLLLLGGVMRVWSFWVLLPGTWYARKWAFVWPRATKAAGSAIAGPPLTAGAEAGPWGRRQRPPPWVEALIPFECAVGDVRPPGSGEAEEGPVRGRPAERRFHLQKDHERPVRR